MSPEVINCLRNEMNIFWDHFESKYQSFSQETQNLIDEKLQEMFKVSSAIKNRDQSSDTFNSCFYSEGDDLTNDFLQTVFDVFKEWQSYEGVQLHKSIYKHTNRSTDNWFPVVRIEEQINECSVLDDNLVVYRGCNQDEFETNTFQQRQSWTRDINIAKTFAYRHPPPSSSLELRVVIKAVINRRDVLWDRGIESEMVLRLGFVPISESIILTYGDYLREQ